MFKDKKKLHHSTYLTALIKSIKDNLFTIALAVFFLFKNGFAFNSFQDVMDNIFPLILFLFTLFSIILKMIDVKIARYWIEDDKVLYSWGMISKKEKEVYIPKIQSVDLSASFANQLLGGAIVSIKTAGEGIELESISKADARALIDYIEQRKSELTGKPISIEVNDELDGTGDDFAVSEAGEGTSGISLNEQPVQHFKTLYELSPKDLFYMSTTSAAMFTTFFLLLGLYSQIDEIIDLDKYMKPVERLIENSVMLVIVIGLFLLFISYVIGIVMTILKYYNYRVTYDGSILKVKYGLLEVKEKVIVVKNIQSIVEEQSLFRKIFNKTSFKVGTTSESQSEDIFGFTEIMPFITKAEGYQIIKELVPDYHYDEVNKVIPKRSIRRYAQIPLLIIAVITAAIQYYWLPKAWIAGLVIAIIIIISAFVKYKYSGYKILNDQITIRDAGLFNLTTSFIKQDKMIELSTNSNPFLNRARLRTVEIKVSAGTIAQTCTLKLIEAEDAEKIYEWFVEKEWQQYEEDAQIEH